MLLLVAQSATSGTDGPYLVFICPILPPLDKFSDVKLGPTSAELGIAMSQLSWIQLSLAMGLGSV